MLLLTKSCQEAKYSLCILTLQLTLMHVLDVTPKRITHTYTHTHTHTHTYTQRIEKKELFSSKVRRVD